MKNRVALSLGILVLLSVGSANLAGQSRDLERKQSADYDRKVEDIRKSLVKLPYYGIFDYLAFSYDETSGKVVLTGQVARPSLKKDAERSVERIEWVKSIDNKIEVLPTSPMDDRIRVALSRAIYGQPALQKYGVGANPSIHIIVKNGNVRLEGVVNNQGDKQIAEAQARTVGGTFAVSNNLQVERGESKTSKAE